MRPGSTSDAGSALAAAGYTPGHLWDTFARTCAPPAPGRTDLRVREAGVREAEVVGDVIRRAFGMPPPISGWIAALAVTETGAPGHDGPGPSHRNITRAGFAVARRRANWSAPARLGIGPVATIP